MLPKRVLAIALSAAVLACGDPGPETREGEGRTEPHSVGGPGRAELVVRGRVSEISVGPDGRVWLASALGEAFTADSIDGDWRAVIRPDPAALDTGMLFQTFDRATFFDEKTGIISGHFGRDELGANDAILRTTDGGASWDTVSVGVDQWVYDVFATRRGEAWIGGSSGQLLHTADAGKTWRRLAAPFDESTRLHSIFMEEGGRGIVGALENGIKTTRDGGATWTAIPTPLDQKRYTSAGGEPANDHRIQEVAFFGAHLLAAQEGRVFATPRGRVDWRPLPGLAAFVVDPETGRAFAVDTTRRVVEIGPGLEPLRLAEEPLPAWPEHLEARGGRLYVLDREGALHRFGGGRTVHTFPLAAGPLAREVNMVRLHGGRLWGMTEHHVYESGDGGRSWTRLGSVPFAIAGAAVLDSGRVMLWDRHGTNAAFDRAGRLAEMAQLRGDDVVGVVQAGGTWAAYGGRQHETADRIEVAQTFSGGQFRGSREHGFVYLSRDRGATWTRVDEWKGSGVASAFVHPDGSMTLFSYLGAVRRLAPSGGGWRAETRIEARKDNRDAVPYVQTVGALFFRNEREGWVDGWIHHRGNKRFVTSDGGRSWREERIRRNHFLRMVPVRGGWAASTGDRVFILSADGEHKVFDTRPLKERFSRHYDQELFRYGIAGLSADDQGNAVVLMHDGEVHVIDPERRSVRRL